MALSKRLRYEILRRDDHTCRYCGGSAPEVKLTVDHVVPTALGGGDDPSNLVTACSECNSGKSATPPGAEIVADVESDAFRWSAAIQAAAEAMLADHGRRTMMHVEFDVAWCKWGVGPADNRQFVPRPDGWERSVDSFIAAGLPMPILIDCIGKAMSNKKLAADAVFRYMCGIAWKKVSELQEAARQQLAVEEQSDDGRAAAYELMYRELLSFIFGQLDGVTSNAEVDAFAAVQREALSEDEVPTALDEEGLAAAHLVGRTAELVFEGRLAQREVLAELPDDEFNRLYDRAEADVHWPQPLRLVDGSSLFTLMVTARMATLHLQGAHEEQAAE